MNNNHKMLIGSFLAGVCNGFFGVGGGLIVVSLLKNYNLKPKVAHATSVAIVAILCILSFIGYYIEGKFNFYESIKFIPPGILGAVYGSTILKKINNDVLRRIFSVIILISSVRLFFKWLWNLFLGF